MDRAEENFGDDLARTLELNETYAVDKLRAGGVVGGVGGYVSTLIWDDDNPSLTFSSLHFFSYGRIIEERSAHHSIRTATAKEDVAVSHPSPREGSTQL